MKYKAVGRSSSRTPVKHDLTDVLFGKAIGAASTGKTPCKKSIYMVDLCAGDGSKKDGIDTSSPYIMHKHAKYCEKNGIDCEIVAIEKNSYTVDQLTLNAKLYGAPAITILHGDARDFSVPGKRKEWCVLVNADPNHVAELPISESFMDSLPSSALMVVTLGCNVGGLKRLRQEERKKWFDYIETIRDRLISRLDVALFSINGDSAQWAYLVVLPKVWCNNYVESVVRRANKKFDIDLASVVLSDGSDFDDEIKRLFLTREEYNASK